MNILFVASECAPLAKVGGLADVIGALPKALRTLGINVRIALPHYQTIDAEAFPSKEITRLTVPFNHAEESVIIRETRLPKSDIVIYLISHPSSIGNGGIYREADASSGGSNVELNRFGIFSRSIPELIKKLNWHPHLVHCHDWQTGALPAIMHAYHPQIKTLFTIHNLAYQGVHQRAHAEHAFGSTLARTLSFDSHGKDKINFLASALANASRITTVSPSYAEEITTAAFGCGLENILKNLPIPTVGILNGIDTEYWNPERDQFIKYPFNASNLEKKRELKKELQKKMHLHVSPNLPLLVMISRLTEQKGFDILLPTLNKLLEAEKFQCIVLASGDKNLAMKMRSLTKTTSEKCVFIERFDEQLAHDMYAAGDFFLMPSRFEPCGLGQMIAMRYGTIPIATSVGGLRDTIIPMQSQIVSQTPDNRATGFILKEYSSFALTETISHALACYHKNSETIAQIAKNGMRCDFSWERSAKKYATLYEDTLKTASPPILL